MKVTAHTLQIYLLLFKLTTLKIPVAVLIRNIFKDPQEIDHLELDFWSHSTRR